MSPKMASLLMLPCSLLPLLLPSVAASVTAWSTLPIPSRPSRTTPPPPCAPLFFAAASPPAASGIAVPVDSKAATIAGPKTKGKTTKGTWFPFRPVDALPGGAEGYDAVVRSAFLRHVLVETEDVADLALEVYLRGGGEALLGVKKNGGDDHEHEHEPVDAFARLARDLSACPLSRDGGGRIGWVDNPASPGTATGPYSDPSAIAVAGGGMISPDAIGRLFRRRIKGGDVLKIPAGDDGEGGWHLIRVDDVSVHFDLGNGDETKGNNLFVAARPKLKGSGIAPLAPRFERRQEREQRLDSDGGGNPIESEDGEGDGSPARDGTLAKYYEIATSGCQMNVADSERLAGVLEHDLGMTSIDADNDADEQQHRKKRQSYKPDVVILNTCTIRDHAEQKVYDALGPHARRKRAGERVAIVVAGCVAQQEGAALLRRFPEIDLVMGPQYIHRLGDLLEEVGRGGQLVATDPTLWSEDWTNPAVRGGGGVRAWVNVIHGCNEHCTYCVVPGVRGVEQSRSMENILRECITLAEGGYREVTLLGQNIDAYGRDMVPKRNFADLLTYLNENIPPGTIERIRYVTSHPRYFSDRVINAVASLDKVCECFHMPFQAGDDDVLRRMRRGYTFDGYMRIIRKIKAAAPDASICGDVIVGFPGETEEQFLRTLEIMEEVKFDNLNTFAYSPRPNTEASAWEADDSMRVPEDVKSDRLQRVQRLAATHAMERSERYVGRTVPVLVEDRNPKNVDQVLGRTRQGRAVFFDGDAELLRGKTVDVEIIEASTWSLVGNMMAK